jgi:hypothetical protein
MPSIAARFDKGFCMEVVPPPTDVILSGVAASLREAAAQPKDP